MLGIMIGVGAVIMLVAVGKGSSSAVQDQLSALGTNTLIVSSGGGFGGGRFGGRSQIGTQSSQVTLTMADVKALRKKSNAPDVKRVAPVVQAQSVTGAYKTSTSDIGQFIGTSPEYAEIRNQTTVAGSFFTQQDVDDHTPCRSRRPDRRFESVRHREPDWQDGEVRERELHDHRRPGVEGLQRFPRSGRHRPRAVHGRSGHAHRQLGEALEHQRRSRLERRHERGVHAGHQHHHHRERLDHDGGVVAERPEPGLAAVRIE